MLQSETTAIFAETLSFLQKNYYFCTSFIFTVFINKNYNEFAITNCTKSKKFA
jgi:hypothetical protein